MSYDLSHDPNDTVTSGYSLGKYHQKKLSFKVLEDDQNEGKESVQKSLVRSNNTRTST